MGDPVFLHPCQHLVLSLFFTLATLIGMECYLVVVLNCISLVANDFEHLFVCLFAICISSLVKCSVYIFCSFICMCTHIYVYTHICTLYICIYLTVAF